MLVDVLESDCHYNIYLFTKLLLWLWQLAVTWKKLVVNLMIWNSVREIARMYDAVMGAIIFVPIVLFSWFPFVSTYQSRVLFNQAFSRGLEISSF